MGEQHTPPFRVFMSMNGTWHAPAADDPSGAACDATISLTRHFEVLGAHPNKVPPGGLCRRNGCRQLIDTAQGHV